MRGSGVFCGLTLPVIQQRGGAGEVTWPAHQQTRLGRFVTVCFGGRFILVLLFCLCCCSVSLAQSCPPFRERSPRALAAIRRDGTLREGLASGGCEICQDGG